MSVRGSAATKGRTGRVGQGVGCRYMGSGLQKSERLAAAKGRTGTGGDRLTKLMVAVRLNGEKGGCYNVGPGWCWTYHQDWNQKDCLEVAGLNKLFWTESVKKTTTLISLRRRGHKLATSLN